MQAWNTFLEIQENLLGKELVDKWLRSLVLVHFDSANLYLEAKDSFQVTWFEEHIRPQLKTKLFNNNHRPIKVHITIPEEGSAPQADLKKGKSKQLSAPPLILNPDPLDPSATLDTFIAGKSNGILFQFFQELIENKIAKGAFNPIYLHGSSGTGKTHLLMALSAAFSKIGISTLYVRSETFTEHVVSAIRSAQMQHFRQSYRNIDLLLVDDVHIFARRAATQEEFFHTFNALHTAGKQIILAANVAPLYLEEIEPRLISRFEWGITFHLEKLDTAELSQVLKNRCKALEFPLSQEVIDFLIQTFPPHPHTLNRALDTLILRTHLGKNQNPIALNRNTAAHLLKELIESEKQSALTPQKVISSVAGYYGISSEDLLGKSQTQECVLPRQIAMHLCRTQLHLPFMKIGNLFSRDHSTVMTSVKQIQSKIEQREPELTLALMEIKKRLV
ncbi:MAG: chromosomal replication initiator protein DnaA [Rhabdochlamydiaceae bacterium]|nr:chromosomal replication initiator protein DnaA [Rhabdochlamydiaceae bacterium]